MTTPSIPPAPVVPPAAAVSPDQLCRYRQLRRDGVTAVQAYRVATATPSALRYRSDPGEAITIATEDRPDLDRFFVTATAEPDPVPDIAWLGTFTDIWSRDVVEVNRHDRVRRYFLPAYTAAARQADLRRRGYSRGVAHDLAVRDVRDDAQLARDLEHWTVQVEVRKAGVLLGVAAMGTDLVPDAALDEEIAAVIDEYGLLDDAAAQARSALLPLIAALAA